MSAPPGDAGASLGIRQAARLVGGWRYVELECFALAGMAAPAAAPDELALFLAAVSRSHAWRAGQLEGLLPVSVGLPSAAECTLSPGAGWDEVLGRLESSSPAWRSGDYGDEDAAARGRRFAAVLLDLVHERLLGEYRSALAACDEVADPPRAAVLRRVSADLGTLLGSGRVLLGDMT